MQPTFDFLTHPDGVSSTARSFDLGRFLQGGRGLSTSPRPERVYSQVSAVYACIKARADALGSMPVRVSLGDDQILESGPLVQLLDRPDPGMTGRTFFRTVEAHLLLFGRSHWRFTRDAGGRPVQVTLLNPLQMRPLLDPRTNALLAWEYRPGGAAPVQPIALDELHTMVDPDFEDPAAAHLGLSPRQVATLAIAQFYKSDLANEASLDNGVQSGGALIFDGDLGEDKVRDIRQEIAERYQGVLNRRRFMVVTGGAKFQDMSKGFAEMEFSELKRMSRVDVCAAFSVPPAVIGYYEDSNYAHAQAALEGFWINTILPRAVWIAEEWDMAVTAAYEGDRSLSLAQARRRGLARHECRAPWFRRAQDAARRAARRYFTWFDASGVPAVQRAHLAISEQAMKWVQAGVPLNHILRAHDLPYPEVPWGDTWFKNIGLVDVRADEYPGANDPDGSPLPPDSLDDSSLPEAMAGFDAPITSPQARHTDLSALVAGNANPTHRSAPRPSDAADGLPHRPSMAPGGWRQSGRETAQRSARRPANPASSSRAASEGSGGTRRGVKAKNATEAQLDRLWHQWRASWAALERHARGRVRRHAHELRTQVLANFKRLEGSLNPGRSLGAIERRDLIAQILFDLVEANGQLLAKFRPLLLEGARLGGEQSMDEAAAATGRNQPDPFRFADPEVMAALRRRELRVTGLNRRLRDKLRNVLADGLEQQLTTDQLADAIRAQFNGLGNRAAVIARTEIGAVVEEGRAIGRVQAGVPLKSWLWSRKETGRQTHAKIEDQTMAQPLPQQAEFVFPETGNTALYPRATGDPRDDVNCGCTTIGRYPNDELRAVIARYQTRGFLTYQALVRRGVAPAAAAPNTPHESQP